MEMSRCDKPDLEVVLRKVRGSEFNSGIVRGTKTNL